MLIVGLIRFVLLATSPFLLVACARETPLGRAEIGGDDALGIAEADVRENLVRYSGYDAEEAKVFSCERYCTLQNQWWAMLAKPLLKEVPNRFVVKVERFEVEGKAPIQEYIYIGSYGTITDHKPW